MSPKVFFTARTEKKKAQSVLKAIRKLDNVLEAHLVEDGIYDVVSLVEVESLEGYRKFVEKASHLKNIIDFESFITVGDE